MLRGQTCQGNFETQGTKDKEENNVSGILRI